MPSGEILNAVTFPARSTGQSILIVFMVLRRALGNRIELSAVNTQIHCGGRLGCPMSQISPYLVNCGLSKISDAVSVRWSVSPSQLPHDEASSYRSS